MLVSYNDFAKLKFKVGKIVEVNGIEGKDRVYLLKVDIGEDNLKTIVAGLKQYYSKDDLKDKIVIVLTNLEPKKLAGYKSEAMLLAADDGNGNVSLLQPDKDMPIGSKIY